MTRLVPGALLLLVLGLAIPGCQGIRDRVAPPAPAPGPASVEIPTEAPPIVPEAPPAPTPSELLATGERHLAAGLYVEAEAAFLSFLEHREEVGSLEIERALWSLALVHLVPESPLRDRERALALLTEVEAGESDPVAALKVRWIRSVLDEVDTLRREATERQALLNQLVETVEQLRRIDLNRRPTVPPPPPPRRDTPPNLHP